jgi:CAAX prenyl protease-like protein
MLEVPEVSPYAPEVCGWSFTLVRLAGSAFVIALIEEYFWRGFLYRWLQGKNFLEVDLGKWHAGVFIAVCVLFGLEHQRWIAGILAGVAYGLLAIRTRDIWAAGVAHVVTNLLLGIYVLATNSYAFW